MQQTHASETGNIIVIIIIMIIPLRKRAAGALVQTGDKENVELTQNKEYRETQEHKTENQECETR